MAFTFYVVLQEGCAIAAGFPGQKAVYDTKAAAEWCAHNGTIQGLKGLYVQACEIVPVADKADTDD